MTKKSDVSKGTARPPAQLPQVPSQTHSANRPAAQLPPPPKKK